MTSPKELKDMENFNDKRNMTNKLPIVGQRYKSFVDDKILKVIRVEGNIFYSINEGETEELPAPIRFLEYFEELPEDNSQQTEEPKVSENAVDKTKEELREEINSEIHRDEQGWAYWYSSYVSLKGKAQALLDAIDAEKASSEKATIDSNNKYITREKNPEFFHEIEKAKKPKSIWKDTLEMAKVALNVGKNHARSARRNTYEFDALEYLITVIEKMQQDIEVLKTKLEGESLADTAARLLLLLVEKNIINFKS